MILPGSERLSGLLVSVRNAVEAGQALEGGATLIDVKEPASGSLGAAAPATWDQVAQIVAGQRPLSAALGELRDWNEALPSGDYSYLKWGLSNLSGTELRRRLADAFGLVQEAGQIPVAVAYADWNQAQCPHPLEIVELGASLGAPILLVDTWVKDGKSLLEHLDLEQLAQLRQRATGIGMQMALAGSLTRAKIETLLRLHPDWFAVRGAVCPEGRDRALDTEKVRELAQWLEAMSRAHSPSSAG